MATNGQGHKRKKRNPFITILLVLIPIFLISGIALAAYLTHPPEAPIQEGSAGGISEGANGDTEGTEGSEGSEGIDYSKEPGQTDQEKPARPPKVYKEDFYTFVVTGTDFEGYHTDTIMVVSLDTAARKVNVVSVPRDSQVDVPGAYKKINAAYANGGAKELKRQLESILGFAPQYSILVDLDAFAKMVDAVGGVEFDVPQDMNYDDNSQNLHIHLEKGRQVLNGEKALQLVRFRGYLSADIGRMQTQQKFLKALAKKVLAPANILKINTFVDIFKQDVKTDLGLRDIQWFAQQVIKLNPETGIAMQTLPYVDDGNYLGQNYLFLSPDGVVDMVNKTINPYTTDITVEDVNIVRIEDSAFEDVTYEMLKNQEVYE